jgi:hypothetical protein
MADALPVFLDIEASGFGAGSYPIEIGCVLADGRTVCCLVRPPEGWQHWDDSAESVHHITRELLMSRGKPIAEVISHLDDALRGQDVFSDAWGNDYAWLSRLYDEAGTVPRFRLRSLRELLNEEQAARWHDAKLRVADELRTTRHRASNDARVLQAAYARVCMPGGATSLASV